MELIAAQLCIVKQIIFGISPPFSPHYMLCILNLFCSVICGVCLRYCGLYSKCRTCQFCYEMTKVILNIESLYFWRLQTCQREPLLALGSQVRGPLFLQLPHSIASSVISSLFTKPPPERKYRRPTRYITEGFKPLMFFLLLFFWLQSTECARCQTSGWCWPPGDSGAGRDAGRTKTVQVSRSVAAQGSGAPLAWIRCHHSPVPLW